MTMLRLKSHSRGLGLSPRRRAARAEALSIIPDGLIAEWRFDEGTGQVLTDYTGNGHHGQLGNTTGSDTADPTWTAQGLSFDGGDRVACDNAGISGGVARTLTLVVKTDSQARFGVEWGGTSTNGSRWTLDRSAAGNLRLDIRGTIFTSTLALPAETWCFIAATQSGADLNTVTLYLDGSAQASGTSGTIDTINPLIWGQANAVTRIMEAAYGLVYDRALSPAEVEQNRNALKVILAARGIMLP